MSVIGPVPAVTWMWLPAPSVRVPARATLAPFIATASGPSVTLPLRNMSPAEVCQTSPSTGDDGATPAVPPRLRKAPPATAGWNVFFAVKVSGLLMKLVKYQTLAR